MKSSFNQNVQRETLYKIEYMDHFQRSSCLLSLSMCDNTDLYLKNSLDLPFFTLESQLIWPKMFSDRVLANELEKNTKTFSKMWYVSHGFTLQ